MTIEIDPEWLRQKYLVENLPCSKIAKLAGICRQLVYKKLKEAGIELKIRIIKNGFFYQDGQRCKISQGYFWIFNPRHRRANMAYVKRAVLILEKKLGRPLQDGEMVHHIDGDRMNDDPSNLEVTDRSNHIRLHRPTDKKWAKGIPEYLRHPIKDSRGKFTGKYSVPKK